MPHSISRRTVLRLGGGILAAAPFVLSSQRAAASGGYLTNIANEVTAVRRPFGRAIQNSLIVREAPSVKAKQVRLLKWLDVVPISGQIVGQGPTDYNPIWYQLADGYVHSAYIQPVENVLNAPVTQLEPGGFWAEVSVPSTLVYYAPQPKATPVTRFFYGCVFRVIQALSDASGQVWYQVNDEFKGAGFYVKAEALRTVPAEDFTPLSPEVPVNLKRIEVNINTQVVTAFEDTKQVFSARVATGGKYKQPDGSTADFFTPKGDHRVFMKIPGQHMEGGTLGYDHYDLPGVSWATYFTVRGVAFHGAYWHNDWGKPRSHGCVNMLPEDAKWVFRWTMPSYTTKDVGRRIYARAQGSVIQVA